MSVGQVLREVHEHMSTDELSVRSLQDLDFWEGFRTLQMAWRTAIVCLKYPIWNTGTTSLIYA